MANYKLKTFDTSNNRPKLYDSNGLTIDFKEVLVTDLPTPTNYTAADDKITTHLSGIDSALATAGAKTFDEADFRIFKTGSPTLELIFNVQALTADHTITMPNADVDLGKVNTAIQAGGSVAFSANQPMGGNKLTGLAAGTTNGDSVRFEQLAAYILLTEKGANSGVCPLDAGGKILASYLPNSVMEYQGVHNVATNLPALADGTGNAGDVYKITTGGTRDYGSGSQTFVTADYIIYNGSIWQLAHSGADAVVSVNGQAGVVSLDTSHISENVANLYFTDERAQDAVGGMVANSASVALAYVDGTPSLTASVRTDGVDKTMIAADVAGFGIQQASDGSLEDDDVRSLVNDDAASFVAGEFGIMEADGHVVKLSAQYAGTINIASNFVCALATVPTTETGKFSVGDMVVGNFTGLSEELPVYAHRTTAGLYVQALTGFVAGEHVIRLGKAVSATAIKFDPTYVVEF